MYMINNVTIEMILDSEITNTSKTSNCYVVCIFTVVQWKHGQLKPWSWWKLLKDVLAPTRLFWCVVYACSGGGGGDAFRQLMLFLMQAYWFQYCIVLNTQSSSFLSYPE